jgi:hypothetical protein
LYSPPNVSVNKSRRIRWKKQIERMGEIKTHTKLSLETLKERDNLEDLVVDEKIILKYFQIK